MPVVLLQIRLQQCGKYSGNNYWTTVWMCIKCFLIFRTAHSTQTALLCPREIWKTTTRKRRNHERRTEFVPFQTHWRWTQEAKAFGHRGLTFCTDHTRHPHNLQWGDGESRRGTNGGEEPQRVCSMNHRLISSAWWSLTDNRGIICQHKHTNMSHFAFKQLRSINIPPSLPVYPPFLSSRASTNAPCNVSFPAPDEQPCVTCWWLCDPSQCGETTWRWCVWTEVDVMSSSFCCVSGHMFPVTCQSQT